MRKKAIIDDLILSRLMATKKGIAITIIILAAITGASFLVWLIPQNIETQIVISDFRVHLDDVKEIHSTINDEVNGEFQKMIDGKITPEEYITLAEASSSQVNSQIIQLVDSKAPEEWYESYLNYIHALRVFNSEIRETVVAAELLNENKTGFEFRDVIKKIDSLKEDSKSLVEASDQSRP